MARVRVSRNVSSVQSGEIHATLAEIRKRYGDKSVTSASTVVQPDRIPTNIFILDFLTLGGIPVSRASMVVGERHAGKSLLAYKTVAGAQKKFPDQQPAYIDVEGTFDPVWASKLGVDLDRLVLFQPETGESAVDVCDAFIGTKEVSIVVIDSVAALTPMKEIDSSAEDALVGVQARLVGGMVRKATASMIRERKRDHNVSLLFVNQFRSKIGGFAGFGEPRSIPGGKALEFSTSLQLIMKNKENSGKDAIGNDTMVLNEHSFTITKNKLNGGGRAGEFRLLRQDNDDLGLTEGEIDDAGTMLAFAKKFGVFHGEGSKTKHLAFWDHELEFRKVDDAVRHLYANRDVYWDLWNFLIASQAQALGMPEEFVNRFLE